jgi:transcription antitermination factor NusG
MFDRDRAEAPGVPRWHALWTHSHCEQAVHDQLARKTFTTFLPKHVVWSRRGGVRRLIQMPMFPGYLFLRHAMDKVSYLEVSRTKGLARVLGERWDDLAVIPDAEIEAVRHVVAAGEEVLPYPYLKEGQRVRMTQGPLAGVEGILIERRPSRGLFVLSVHMLQRSVAIVVDATEAVPA